MLISRAIILTQFFFIIVSPAYARMSGTDGKRSAPDIEDHASYFREKRIKISDSDRQKADQLRQKSIVSIQGMIAKNKSTESRFELMLRLGELYIERHDYLRDLAMEQYANAWEEWSKNPGGGKRGNEPKVDFSAAEKELAQGAKAFQQLVSQFPKHRRTDAAIYALAQSLARLGQEGAVEYYKKLIALHPKSSLVPDAYLSLGEYYFDKHMIVEAIDNYKKVLNYKNHRAYPYAVYKLGWAHFNAPQKSQGESEKNYKKAISSFKLVVSLSGKKNKKNGGGSNFDLREEALRDLVMVWAESEDVNAAWSYFRSIGEQESFYKVLERLGNIYADQGKNEKASLVFQRLLKEAPKRDRNPWVHAKLIEIFDNMNKLSEAVVELKNMPKLYIGETKWVLANRKPPESLLIGQARELVENSLHRFGTIFHQRGQKSKSDNYLAAAASVYAAYLETFPKSKAAYELRYYLAEIQFDFKKYEEASANYLKVVQQDPAGKFYKTAAFNSVATLHSKIASEKFAKTPPLGQASEVLPLPSSKKLLVETIDAYLKILPNESESNNMRFEAAQIYFEYGHYPEALMRFEKIAGQYPDSKQAETSVKIILAYYAQRQDWQSVIKLGQNYSRKKDLEKNTKLQKFIVDSVREATFSLASSYEKSDKFDLAATTFLAYQKQFPGDDSADRAVYNAMNNYFKIGKTESAMTVGRTLIKEYPKSKLLPDVLADMASTYEGLASFVEAAAIYQRLGSSFSNDKRAPTALYNAAILYRGLKKYSESVDCLREFLKKFPDNKIASDVHLELAGLYEKQEDIRSAIESYEILSRSFPNRQDLVAFATVKAAVLRITKVNSKEASSELQRIRVNIQKIDPNLSYQAREVLASALFKSVDESFSEFIGIKFTDSSSLENKIAEKQKNLVKLSDRYEQIIDLGSGEYVVASLYRLGEAHENFAQSLMRASAPREISQTDRDKFKTELEKLGFPLREQAYKFFEMAMKRSAEVRTFSEWTRRSYKKMAEIVPDKIRAVEDIAAEPSYLSHDLGQDDATLVKLYEKSLGGEQ